MRELRRSLLCPSPLAGEGGSEVPVERQVLPSPRVRAFTPVFAGYGEGAQ